MRNTSLLNLRGEISWVSQYPAPFPRELVCRRRLWELSSGLHAERIRQDFSLAIVNDGQPHSGVHSFVSPVDLATYSYQCTYQFVSDVAVACLWKPVVAVSILSDRERELIQLSTEGDMDTKKICDLTGMSDTAVYKLWESIRHKLDRETNMGAAWRAQELGLLDEP
jgi:DNA-binding CsgD family transcriptional regulator